MSAYQRWLRKVDDIVKNKLGVGVNDLPDNTDLGALYASDLTPLDAASCVLEDQGVNW